MNKEYKQKCAIIPVFMKLAAFDGWNKATLVKSVKNLNLDKNYAEILFPDGINDFVEFFVDNLNANLAEEISKNKDFSEKKISEKIEILVWERIKLLNKNKLAIKQLSYYLSLPNNYFIASNSVWKTVDSMWKIANDKSTDFNYYTKRLTLSLVYSSSLLYWLKDESDQSKDTEEFIKRRIENVMQFHKGKARVADFAKKIVNKF